ncbi:MAG: hypothetical protein HRT35_21265 [Algicola sp.]|nr:hypothetical protein [Algicola sp.]
MTILARQILVHLIFIAVTAIAVFATYAQITQPFFMPFWLAVFTAIFALVGYLIYIARAIKNKMPIVSKITTAAAVVIFALALVIKYDYRLVFFPSTLNTLTTAQWQADLQQLKQQLYAIHPNIDDMITRDKFDQQFNKISQHLHSWTSDRIKIEMMHLVAMLNDGHTIIPPQPAIDFHILPIVLHKFEDGFYIIDAARHYSHLINKKLVKIGNTPVKQVFEQIKQHIGTEHISGKYDRASLYLGMTELLFELGLSPMNTRALVEVESAGVTEVTEMRGEPYYQWYAFYMLAKNEREPLPYAHRLSKQNYWSEFDQSSGILTININNIKNDSDGPTFKVFSTMVGEQIKKMKFKKVVVDLRDNRGGSNFMARHFSTMLAKAYKLNTPGKLFVLTSGRTFSAAVNLSSLLENQTNAIFVGQPTGQGPNQYGDATGVKLDNSGIFLFISTLPWRGSFEQDKRTTITPHYPIKYYFADYLNDKDPAMDFVSQYQHTPRKRSARVHFPTRKYLYNEVNVVTFHLDLGGLQMKMDDYIDHTLHTIDTVLYHEGDGVFATDIRNLKVRLYQGHPQLLLDGNVLKLKAINRDFKTPMQQVAEGEILAGLARMKVAQAKGGYQGIPFENTFNNLGYKLMLAGKKAQALAILQYNTELYFDSANAWDSLGEAQMANKLFVEAHASYLHSLSLNPSNRNAEDMLARLAQEVK